MEKRGESPRSRETTTTLLKAFNLLKSRLDRKLGLSYSKGSLVLLSNCLIAIGRAAMTWMGDCSRLAALEFLMHRTFSTPILSELPILHRITECLIVIQDVDINCSSSILRPLRPQETNPRRSWTFPICSPSSSSSSINNISVMVTSLRMWTSVNQKMSNPSILRSNNSILPTQSPNLRDSEETPHLTMLRTPQRPQATILPQVVNIS